MAWPMHGSDSCSNHVDAIARRERADPGASRRELYGTPTACNRFTGPYTVSGSLLTFGTMAMTRMACLDSALDHQETAFAAALGTSTRYAIVADTLRLFSGSAMRLQFAR